MHLICEYPPVRVYHHADLRSFKPQVKLPGELPSDQRLEGVWWTRVPQRGRPGLRAGRADCSGPFPLRQHTGLLQDSPADTKSECAKLPCKRREGNREGLTKNRWGAGHPWWHSKRALRMQEAVVGNLEERGRSGLVRLREKVTEKIGPSELCSELRCPYF